MRHFTPQTKEPGIRVGSSSNSSEVADSTIMRKWKSAFVSGCERKNPMSTATEFLNSCQDGAPMRKWKLRFVSGCKYKNPNATTTELLNLRQDGTSTSMYLGVTLESNDITVG